MRIRALTIVVVEEEKKPPAFTLIGNLTIQEAYAILHDFLLQEAKEQGKAEAERKIPKNKQKPSQQAPSDSEGGSEG